jgi:prohibitin 1
LLGKGVFSSNYYLAAIPCCLYSKNRDQPKQKKVANYPRQEIAVLRQGTSTIRKKEKEFCLMSHFDPRIINSNPKSISGTPILVGMGFVFILILLWASVAYVPPGNVGVLVYFGRVTGETLPAGTHFVSPFKINHVFSVRTQAQEEHTSTPSMEGLNLEIDTSLIYHLDQSHAADVYSKLGPDYARTIIDPNLRSVIRDTTAGHSANTLYSSSRKQVEDEIRTGLKATLEPRGIVVESVLLRDIQLPHTLKASIETKQQAEQESLAMNFRLQKERQEADRKRIEAQGIHDFQQIVAQGISAQLLQWKGIEATETLAKSPNSKIIVIGNPKNGLPLIMGQE